MRSATGVGLGVESAHKYRDAVGLLPMVIKIAKGALARKPSWPQLYTWVDLNAGPGRHTLADGTSVDGTPIIALRALIQCEHVFRAVFIERQAANAELLRARIEAEFGSREDVQVLCGDNRRLGRVVLCDRRGYGGLGAIVHDPTEVVDFGLLSQLASLPGRSRHDLLVYVSATAIKRPRSLSDRFNTDRSTLRERMGRCGKKLWIVRKPAGKAEWTWLVGTQWADMPAWRKSGFDPWDSDAGALSLQRLDMTAVERRAHMQPPLF